jgi:hypothetical protein
LVGTSCETLLHCVGNIYVIQIYVRFLVKTIPLVSMLRYKLTTEPQENGISRLTLISQQHSEYSFIIVFIYAAS